jgi:hypothetical protein
MDMDETFVKVVVRDSDLMQGAPYVASLINNVIARYAH